MNLNDTRFQHTLFKNHSVQQVIVALIRIFGTSAFLHCVAAAVKQVEREKREMDAAAKEIERNLR